MDNRSGNKRIAKNTIALYIRMGITMLISFYTTRIILEILGIDDFGLNNVVASVVSMFGFINGSMGTAVQRFFSVELGKNKEGSLSKIFSTSLYLHIIVAIITLFIAEIFAIFFLAKLNIPQERIFAAQVVFQISAFSLAANILNVPFAALLRAREEFSKIAIFDIIQALLRLGVLFLLYRINYDKLITLSSLNLGVTLLYILGITLLAKRFEEVRFQIVYDKKIGKKMLSFISMLLFTVLASVFNKQGIVIVVNLFFGLTINAAYAVAFQVARLIETFAMSFKQSVIPQLMQAYGANDLARMTRLMFLGTKVTFLLMILLSIPLIFEIDFILNLWLKNPPEYASVFSMLIVISVNIDTFYYFIYQAVHSSGRIKKQQILISISYILSILIIYFAFELGANFYYAAYIPIVFSIIRNVFVIFSAMETINFNAKYFISQVILPCLALVTFLALFSALLHLLLTDSLIRFLLILSLNSILTLLLGYVLVLNKTEKKILLGLIFKS